MKNRNLQTVNVEFYEAAYSRRYILIVLLKQLLSFDQLSKARLNLRFVAKIPDFRRKLAILDYGFGRGTFLQKLPRRHGISGCELSSEAIGNLRRLFALRFRKVSIYTPDELIASSDLLQFDVISCSHVIEHVDDDERLLRLFRSLLRVGGYLLLNVPINEVWEDPKHVRRYSVESVRLQLSKLGFAVECILEADRWTAFILHHEYVLKTSHRLMFRILRFTLALMPASLSDALETLLPRSYRCQQLLVLARKAT